MSINLKGKRILVTRNEPKASAFAEQIVTHGGEAIIAPLIQITCSTLNENVVDQVGSYEWLIFTSANGVHCFFQQIDCACVKHVNIAVVGAKTNEALRAYEVEADFIPSVYNAKTMAPAFIRKMRPKGKVLIVRGRLSGTVVNKALTQENIPFDCVEMYDTEPNFAAKSTLQRALKKIDCITFTSPSTVDAFMTLADHPEDFYHMSVFAIGTTTEKRARERGFTYVYTPKVFTVEGMLERMGTYMNDERISEHDDTDKF